MDVAVSSAAPVMQLIEPGSVEDVFHAAALLKSAHVLAVGVLLYFVKRKRLYRKAAVPHETFKSWFQAEKERFGFEYYAALARARAGAIIVTLHRKHGYPLQGEGV